MGEMLCLVGLLIRLGLILHKGASDLLAITLLLLHFHKDTIGYHDDTDSFVKKFSRIAASEQEDSLLLGYILGWAT